MALPLRNSLQEGKMLVMVEAHYLVAKGRKKDKKKNQKAIKGVKINIVETSAHYQFTSNTYIHIVRTSCWVYIYNYVTISYFNYL